MYSCLLPLGKVWGLWIGCSVGLARTIYIRCICGVLGREITLYTVIYRVNIRPALVVS